MIKDFFSCALHLGVLEILLRLFLCCAISCVLEYIFRELSLDKNLYKYLRKVDILLIQTSWRYGDMLPRNHEQKV